MADIIKDAVKQLVLEKPYRQITVVGIARIAQINRKTFYNHFPTIRDVLIAIEQDYVADIREQMSALAPDDIKGAILIYYKFLNTDDRVIQRLLYGSDYQPFFRRLDHDVMSSDFFMKFCPNEDYVDTFIGYMDAVTGIFTRWHHEPEHSLGIEELAARTSELIYYGIKGPSRELS